MAEVTHTILMLITKCYVRMYIMCLHPIICACIVREHNYDQTYDDCKRYKIIIIKVYIMLPLYPKIVLVFCLTLTVPTSVLVRRSLHRTESIFATYQVISTVPFCIPNYYS